MFSIEIKGNNFSLLETSDQPVLVDFWSPNCPHCKVVLPAVEDLAEKHLGRLWVAKAQAEMNPDAIGRFKIEGLPSFVMFKGGKEVDRLVGGVRWVVLNEFIERHA